MTERQLQHAVIECAQTLGWRVAHFRPARVKRGGREIYETPVAADGKGFPDLVMVRGGGEPRLIFAELKSAGGSTSPAQDEWLEQLDAVAEQTCIRGTDDRWLRVEVWLPNDWTSGRIEELLR